MRAEEFLSEAYSDIGIRDILRKKGYKFLGSGVDQTAYLAPDGMILKIFGTKRSTKPGNLELTKAQKTFKAFADYCNKHSNNPFLPQFSGWNVFEYKGKPYLQIKMERLFPFTGATQDIDEVLEKIADSAEFTNSAEAKERFINSHLKVYNPNKGYDPESEPSEHVEAFKKLIGLIGRDGFDTLWDTIFDLGKVAESIKLSNLDLHSGNFMLGSDGQIVISDPFYAGWSA
jgi:hypothetical protein